MNRFIKAKRISNKAQNFVEYTLVLVIVGVALMAMQTYFKRGIQSVVKVVADDLGPQGEPFRNRKKAEEKRQINEAFKKYAKEKFNYDNKLSYTTGYSQKVTIQNDGEGAISRTIKNATATFEEKSY